MFSRLSRSHSTSRESSSSLDHDSSTRNDKNRPSRPESTNYDLSSSPWTDIGSASSSTLPPVRKKRPIVRNYEPSISFNTCPLRNAMYLSGILEEMDTDPEPLLSTTPAHSLLTFPRRPVTAVEPKNSALTAAIADNSVSSSNPFLKFKPSVIPKKGQPQIKAKVYFPYAEQPLAQSMSLVIKEDATVRDLLGLALYTYSDRYWLPLMSVEANHLADWGLYLVDGDGYMNFETEAPDLSDRLELLSAEHVYAVIRSPSLGRHALKIAPEPIHKRHSSLPGKRRQSMWHGRALSLPVPSPPVDKLSIIVLDVVSHEKESALAPPETYLETSSQSQIKDVLRMACQVRGIPSSQYKTYTLLVADKITGFKSLNPDLRLSESGYSVFILVKHKVKLA